MQPSEENDTRRWSRRRTLGWLGAAVGGAALVNCGGGDDTGGSGTSSGTSSGTASGAAGGGTTGSTTSSTTSSTTAGTCASTLEGEIGPYFTDDSASGYQRSDIRANLDGSSVQSGIPLTLRLYVVDYGNNCAPYQGAQVDIWHCNASGVYSNESVENTLGQSWLRGYQITDASGYVQFKTIIPGWYQGRTTHIHLRVRSGYGNSGSTSDGSNTTQLFFPQSLVDSIDTGVAPYSAEGRNPTTNAGDRVYAQQTLGKNELTPSGDTSDGYTATFTIGLPIQA